MTTPDVRPVSPVRQHRKAMLITDNVFVLADLSALSDLFALFVNESSAVKLGGQGIETLDAIKTHNQSMTVSQTKCRSSAF